MMNKTKTFNVTLFGDHYTLVSDESDCHVANVCSKVNAIMQEIANKTKSSDGKKVAILAAVQLANQLLALESKYNQVQDCNEKLLSKIEKELLS